MKIKNGFMLRKVGKQHVVVALGKASRSFNGIIKLNDTGAFLWGQLTSDKTQDELVSALLNEYDVAPEKAAEDVAGFVKTLEKAALFE